MPGVSEFLKNYKSKKNITHTRIGSEYVYGGAYSIPENKMEEFYKLYYEHVFTNGKKEYLTEKQNTVNGGIMIDFDFRYKGKTKRQHSDDHILDIIELYINTLKKLLIFDDKELFDSFNAQEFLL